MTDNTAALNAFFNTNKIKVLRGKAKISSSDISFNPDLRRARTDDKRCLKFLTDYLETYNITEDGKVSFSNEGEFEVYKHMNGLTLYLHPKASWMSSSAVMVIDFRRATPKELEKMLAALRDADQRTWGEIIDKKVYEDHAVLRKYSNSA